MAGVCYAGPDPQTLEQIVFERAADLAAQTPQSVLYLAPRAADEYAIRKRWANAGSPLQLHIVGFDDLVRDAFEHATYRGRASSMPLHVRYRLLEVALTKLSDQENPLIPSQEAPRGGLVSQTEDLLSLLEFAGLLTPDEIEDRLSKEGLPEIGGQLAAVVDEFQTARGALVDAPESLSLRSERYLRTLDQPDSLADVLGPVDVAIIGPFTLFSPLEARLVEAISEDVQTFAILPQHNNTTQLTGVDTAVWRPHDCYQVAGFDRRYETPTPDTKRRARHHLTKRLYRFNETEPEPARDFGAADGLDWRTYPTPGAEITGIARDLRHRLTTEAIDPGDIGIVTTSPSDYTPELLEALDVHDVPVAASTSVGVSETAHGQLLDLSLELATTGPPHPALLLDILENPLVERSRFLTSKEFAEFRRAVTHAETASLQTLCTHLDHGATIIDAADTLTDATDSIVTADAGTLLGAVESFYNAVGATDAALERLSPSRHRLESQAREELERFFESFQQTAPLTQTDSLAETVRRALTMVEVSITPVRDDAHVTITDLGSIPAQTFEHVYVVGLTTTHFPSNPARLVFTRRLNDAHPDFAETDRREHARFGFTSLLTTSETVILSHPSRSLAGEPFIEAGVLAELRQQTDLSPTHYTHNSHPAGTAEAQHHRLAQSIARAENPSGLIEDALPALEVPTGSDLRVRLPAGATAATARAQDTVTEYDGWIGSEPASELHPSGAFSPSRLERYAACGFKYYMQHVLDIKSPDEITLDPDALDRGGYIHAVLERYYKSLQTNDGNPVQPGNTPAHQAELLEAAKTELDRFQGPDTAFHDGWLTQVFAGLQPLEENPYPGSDGDRGLLVHFLEAEGDGATTGYPAYLEGRVGNPRNEDETVLNSEPITIGDSTVPLKGIVDRIDVVPDTNPTEVVAYDYKTGSTPSAPETLEGLRFQLPIYLLFADQLLEDVSAVGASYYQVKPPTSVGYGKGQIAASDDGKSNWGDDPAPIRYWRSPEHDSRDEFHDFLYNTVLDRIETIAHGVEGGIYHPTLIDPSKAGCRHCDYREVCDVRSHRRRDVIHELDTNKPDIPVYVPEYARELAEEPDE